MPRVAIGIALRSIRKIGRITSDQIGDIEIGYLARIFGLSFRRREDLDLLPLGGAYALNQELIKRYRSAEKRGDELGLPRRSEYGLSANTEGAARCGCVEHEVWRNLSWEGRQYARSFRLRSVQRK
jgi:hypothetical protein